MKPVAYLLDRTLAQHALVLAMRAVLSRKWARPLGAKALQEKSGTFSGALANKVERGRLKGACQ